MTDCKESGLGDLDIECVRDALSRVLSNPHFVGAPRLAAFLKFIVETTLEGDARSIKAYTIATMALGRPESFDPAADAIVRVEANRLRTALARYYAFDGEADTIIIELPRRSYVPRIRHRNVNDDATAGPATASTWSREKVSGPEPFADNGSKSEENLLETLIDEYHHWVLDIVRNLVQIRDELTHARAAVAVSNTLIRIKNKSKLPNLAAEQKAISDVHEDKTSTSETHAAGGGQDRDHDMFSGAEE
ncbi:MAG: hypothetical protein KGO02_11485 [Alphaproteobacteria bacterium]|nr:hypothetical protein [Alphaproteobacteria bacterium]